MMKIRHLVLTICSLLLAMTAGAQKLTVEKMELAPMDLSASTQPRNDRNGNPCALVKVQLPAVGAQFEGNVLGDVAYKTGEYWVYMSEGSYMLNIKHPNAHPLMVNFRDYDIKRVEGKTTYVLTLLMPQAGPVNMDDGTRFLVMTVQPADGAQVKIDGQPQSLRNGSLSLLLPPGQHTYLVESAGYAPQQGTFTIAGEKVTLPIRLESTKATLSVSCATTGVDIYVNEQREGTGSWSGTLQPGIYRIEGRKQGYRTAIQTVTLAERGNERLELPELQPIVGNISVDYQPINAEVWLDGKKLGTSPDVFRNIIIGSHSLELRADGYLADTKTITVEEGKTLTLTGQMTPKPKDEFEGKTASEIAKTADDYYWGTNGKTKDYAEAVKWWHKAAEQGHDRAQYNFGWCYEKGRGVTQDYAEAVKWYRKAADQGYANAQYSLGVCYYNGQGVPQDRNKAKELWRKAAAKGYQLAKDNLKKFFNENY